MRTWQLGLLAGLVAGWSWGCGGAEDGPDDGLYDIPVAAPSPNAWQRRAQPDAAGDAERAGDVGAPEASGASDPSEEAATEEAATEEAATEEAATDSAPTGALRGLTAAGELSEQELFAALAQAPGVCFGETHDNAAHHRAQARAAADLAARAREAGTPLAIGFEMFQTPFQAVLTSFALGSIDEAARCAAASMRRAGATTSGSTGPCSSWRASIACPRWR